LGKQVNVPSGSTSSIYFTRAFDTTILWKVFVTDGKLSNMSDIWYFTTKKRPPENKRPVSDPGGPYSVGADGLVHFNSSESYDPDGDIDFYRWNFGDGSSEILAANPRHTYKSPGTYEVILTVIDDEGTSATNTTFVTMTAVEPPQNQAPIAIISGSYKAKVGEPLTFDGSKSYDSDGSIVSFQWNFGGSNTATGATPNYVFQEEGMHVVSLTVTDDDGDTHQASVTVTIERAPFLGIPGFETFLFLFAIYVIYLILYRKK